MESDLGEQLGRAAKAGDNAGVERLLTAGVKVNSVSGVE